MMKLKKKQDQDHSIKTTERTGPKRNILQIRKPPHVNLNRDYLESIKFSLTKASTQCMHQYY